MSVEIRDERTGRESALRKDGNGIAEVGKSSAPASAVVRDVRLLLMALWLGAAVYFSFAVAPSAFAVLPARELAGSLVTRTLAIVNVGGFLVSLLLLLSLKIGRGRTSRRAFVAEALALASIAVMTAVGQWVIAARLLALRAQMGRPIDDVAIDHPLRVEFNGLHRYSVLALGVGMVAGIVALLVARRGE